MLLLLTVIGVVLLALAGFGLSRPWFHPQWLGAAVISGVICTLLARMAGVEVDG